MNIDRLEWHLENWVKLMQHGDSHKLGYPSKSLCMMGGGAIGEDDSEIMGEEADTVAANALDAIIDSISLPQRTAVNHHWLGVWHHYPTQELDLDEAYTAIMKLADKRGLV
jgi:hypothetical protein